MKRYIFSILTALVAIAAFAAAPVISFDSTTYDFGNIKEAAGPVSHDFVIDVYKRQTLAHGLPATPSRRSFSARR